MDEEGTPLRVHKVFQGDNEHRTKNMKQHVVHLLSRSEMKHGNEREPTKISVLDKKGYLTVLCRKDGTLYHPNTGHSFKFQDNNRIPPAPILASVNEKVPS